MSPDIHNHDDTVRISVTLNAELAGTLSAISDALNLTVSGVIQLLLEQTDPDSLLISLNELISDDYERISRLPLAFRKEKTKKRPTRENLAAVRTQLGQLVTTNNKVDVYVRGNYT